MTDENEVIANEVVATPEVTEEAKEVIATPEVTEANEEATPA